MCGRFACTLSPGNIVKACTYKDKSGDTVAPHWTDASDGGTYYPSSNIPPTSYTPVLFKSDNDEIRQIQPMLWGLVPYWHSGTDPKSHGLSTHNARREGLQNSRLYQRYLEQRCVVVCDGFYEWLQKSAGAKKQPYLVYAKQKKDHDIEELLEYKKDPDTEIDESDWSGPSLLYLAGLYSVWRDDNDVTVHSFTIITRDSKPGLSWLHNRAPCILSTPAKIRQWLDPETDVDKAISLLGPVQEKYLEWHPVSLDVGNVRNQEPDLIKEVKPLPDSKSKSGSSKGSKNLMDNWIQKSPAPGKSEKKDTSEASQNSELQAGSSSDIKKEENEQAKKRIKLDHEIDTDTETFDHLDEIHHDDQQSVADSKYTPQDEDFADEIDSD